MYWAPNAKFGISAAAVFQGGGIRGLFFPGHITGLRQKGIDPFVYAGASAGTLVAVGIWSGLTAHDLNDFLRVRCGRIGLASALFSKAELASLVLSWGRVCLMAPANLLLRLVSKRIETFPGCNGDVLEQLIDEMILQGLHQRGIHGELIKDLFAVDPENFHPTFRDIGRLVNWIRVVTEIRSPDDPNLQPVLKVYSPKGLDPNKITFKEKNGQIFNDIWRMVYGRESAPNPYFAPIFISTCCIDDREPVIFNNIEKRYWDIPIAHIARASAGHPIVFKPKVLNLDGTVKRYSDGGLMANFPAFAVHGALKNLFDRKNVLELPQDYRELVTVPFVTLGLAATDQPPRASYLEEIRGILLGGARERLEYQLAATAPYFRLVRQTVNGEPHYLNFAGVTPELIKRTFNKARKFMQGEKISASVDLGKPQMINALQRNLEGMLQAFERTFPRDPRQTIEYTRIHLYFEGNEERGVFRKTAMLCNGGAAATFGDQEQSIRKAFSGLIGLVRMSGFPVLARLNVVQKMREDKPNLEILGLKWADTQHLPRDLKLALILPICDYHNMSYETGDVAIDTLRGCEEFVRTIDGGIRGPLLGAISVDCSCASADRDIDWLTNEVRTSGLLDSLERYSLEIGTIVSQEIAKMMDS
jgi:hypothetical protein